MYSQGDFSHVTNLSNGYTDRVKLLNVFCLKINKTSPGSINSFIFILTFMVLLPCAGDGDTAESRENLLVGGRWQQSK